MRRRWWLALGVAIAALAALALWLARRDHGDIPPVVLDVGAARARQTARLELARQLAAKPALAPTPQPRGSGRWPMQGLGAQPHFGKGLIDPQCILGPHELCVALADLIDGCDGGDAPDCMAVGQFLADTPPRPMIANVFFVQACRIGDAAGCERLDELKQPSDAPCDQDPFACGWRALRAHDAAKLDEACSLGMADACADMEYMTKVDVDRARAYLETACQLGSPMVCSELADRLSPACVATDVRPCYQPDAALAAAAREMACLAGWHGEVPCP